MDMPGGKMRKPLDKPARMVYDINRKQSGRL